MTLPVLIIGGGGHAKVVIDVLRSVGDFEPIGYLARQPGPPLGGTVPFLGGDEDLPALKATARHAFVAIGHNATRQTVSRIVAEQGYLIPAAISAYAIISPSARIGRGVAIMPGAVVSTDASICDFAIVNTRSSVDHDAIVGESAHIAPGVSLCGNVVIGALAFVGAGASIIPGVKIGHGAIVGAGAVVIRDLPPEVTAVGVPARPI